MLKETNTPTRPRIEPGSPDPKSDALTIRPVRPPPDKFMLQPVEEMIFDSNSTEIYKNIFRHETELKWIKLLQTPIPLGFNDNIYHQGNISKMPDFDVFSLLDIRRPNRRSRGKLKTVI